MNKIKFLITISLVACSLISAVLIGTASFMMREQIFLISCFIFVFSIFISVHLGNYISKPFAKLDEISQKLIEMDFSIKIDENYKIAEIKSFVGALKQFIKVSRENQKNKELVNSIFDSLIDALFVVNEKGIIFSSNPSVMQTFGYSKKEIIGKPIDKLFKECFFSCKPNTSKNDSHYNLVNNKVEITCVRKDNSFFPAEVGINELIIGEKTCFTVLIRDISYQKQIDTMKNDFVSTVSHELRTPLTSIMGVLGLLLNIDFEKNPENTRELLTIANNNSTRLLNLVNDILDMQKLEAGKIDFTYSKINLSELIENLIKLNKSYGDKYSVSLNFVNQVAEPVYIRADKDRFSQSVTNLISNAIKFSPTNGEVRIILSKNNDIVKVSVEDKGKGIPDSLRSKIFRKFSQLAETNTRSKDGTGLGLYITKYLIENMNGKIDFCSEAENGTTFFVEFPILEVPVSL
jgi:PAS domain S-box-containing protein